MQIFCFGDSITWGSWEPAGGWADRLKRSFYEYIESRPDAWVEVYNLGIPGDTTDDCAERFLPETLPRIDTTRLDNVFLFAFGANDVAIDASSHAFRCPPERFERNLRMCIASAKALHGNVFLLTITPVIEPLCASNTSTRANASIVQYNAIIKHIAQEENVTLINVHQAFLEYGPEKLLCTQDGLHPNERGHELLFSLVRSALQFDREISL